MDSGEYVLGVVTRWGEEQMQYKLAVEYKTDQCSKIQSETENSSLAKKEQLVSKPISGIPNNLTRQASTASLDSFDSGYSGLSL